MTTSMLTPTAGRFWRWRPAVALVSGILVAMAMLVCAPTPPSGAQTPGPVQAIAAGSNHGLALVNDPETGSGTVYAWGGNYYGQIGDGTRLNDRFPPRRVLGENGVGYLTGMKAIQGWR